MYALDKLKVVMPLESITILNEDRFTIKSQYGHIESRTYTQQIPVYLYIKIDYWKSEAVIEFTGKILGNRYEELIRLTNIKQCVDNINSFGIIRIDRDEISRAIVVKCDLTIDVDVSYIPALTSYIKNSISNYDAYTTKLKRNGNLILEKNVDTGKCKKRLTIYDKEKEMNMAKNRSFIGKYYNGVNPFVGKCRFELNLFAQEAIRKSLDIENTTVWNVLLSARVKNPIRDFLSEILIKNESNRHIPNVKAYYYDLVLDDNDNDMKKVYDKFKSLCAKGTKISRTIAPIQERLKTRDYTMILFSRNKILDMISSETRISSSDVFGYSSL